MKNGKLRRSGPKVAAYVAACVLGLDLAGPQAAADAIRYSASGSVVISNEPDSGLSGVVGQDASGLKPGDAGYKPGWNLLLGAITVNPTYFADNTTTSPNFGGSPFDIKIAFDHDLPTLELKGMFQFGGDYAHGIVSTGFVDSIVVTPIPWLAANLPTPFANMLAHPEGIRIGIEGGDWGTSRLNLYAQYNPVPEPATVTAFLSLLAGLALHRYRSAGRQKA